jgi:low affinity Fe/Cu permease
MKTPKISTIARIFDRISTSITRLAGRPIAFLVAALLIIIWAVTGPIFDYSNTWQLVINTSTTIITFLMVFIIQQSQNKDTLALQLKLNELIACNENASNRLIVIEDLTEDELAVLKKFYVKLSQLAQKENELHTSHSIDEADNYHLRKHKIKKNDKNNSTGNEDSKPNKQNTKTRDDLK